MSEVTPLKHLVIIPDGNRRWSKQSGLPVWEGHRRSAEKLGNILEACKEKEVKYLTMWGFSTENWKRDLEEVNFLMDLFIQLLSSKKNDLIKNEIRFRHLGRKDRLPEKLLSVIDEVESETKQFTEWNYQVCLDYGGRDEIIRAANAILRSRKESGDWGDITEEEFAGVLDTKDIPNPDLILRTSGEKRLSGMMPFQSVYSELAFIEKNYPDVTKEDVISVIDEYYNRQRRFGGS